MVVVDEQLMDVPMEELGSSQKSTSLSSSSHCKLRGHRLSATCVCVDSRGKVAFTGSKEGSILKWCLKTNKVLARIAQATKEQNAKHNPSKQKPKKSKLYPHIRHINCMAISSDDKYLVTGGWDKVVRVWSVDTLELVDSLVKHKDEITGLVFRVDQHTLYSSSADRSVIVWSFEDEENRSYVESLYGHESTITSIDALRKERVISSGGRDQSIRIWKIVEQAQTVFQTKHQSVDVVRLVDDRTFVSGGEDGSICVWTTMKRSPVLVLKNAHPHQDTAGDGSQQDVCKWITALAAVSLKDAKQPDRVNKKRKLDQEEEEEEDFAAAFDGHDEPDDDDEEEQAESDDDQDKSKKVIGLVASGSCNSVINVWKLIKTSGKYSLVIHKSFECPGFINDLRFSHNNKKLVAACGQEHKAGRWWKLNKGKNCLKVFKLNNEEVD